ncbi:MAG: YhfC family intramembrane metalloprotease [Chloroflexi bacterium]|nr:YhfC family intramembrane metalloprotease [Chloroflexota bacterium]
MTVFRIVSILVLVLLLGGGLAFLLLNPYAIPPFLNGGLMVALPLGLGIWIARRYRQDWRLFGIGAVTFVLSQVLHIPFNALALNPLLARLGVDLQAPSGAGLLAFALALGLSSGLFEETARLVVLRRWLKDARSWAEGLMFGAGHGGVEAMLIGALVIYIFLQMIVLRASSPEALAVLVGSENIAAVQAQLAAYWGSAWYDHLLGALERVGAMSFHLSAALLVMKAVVSGQSRWYWAAVGWHALLNGVSLVALHTLGAYAAEALLLGFAVLSLLIAARLRRGLPEFSPEPIVAAPVPPVTPVPQAAPSLDIIEDSRYD